MAQAIVILLTALIAKHLGGDAKAQWIAAVCVAISPVSLSANALFQYVSFDFLWWVLVCYFMARLIESDDPRWWLGIGAAIGLGVLTKYTIAFFVAGLVAGVLATDLRRHLHSRWLWIGAAISVAVALPNLIWQATHGFVTLEFLRFIHARDVRIGRTKDFFLDQILDSANPFTLPVWIVGVITAVRVKRLRIFAWMWFVPMALFIIAQGRGYYSAPLYSMLFAIGAVTSANAALFILFALGLVAVPFNVPLAPPTSRLFRVASNVNHDFAEEFGWPEMTGEVVRIWSALPPDERAHAAILCANYGEAGAIDRYGPEHGLPPAISGINSFWARGYGNPPPQTVIVLGHSRSWIEQHFADSRVAGRIPNPYNLANEESERPDIWICRGLKEPWPEFWQKQRSFG